MHPAGLGPVAGRYVGGQRLVSGRIAVVRGDPGELQAVRRHPAGGLRRTPVFHNQLIAATG